MRTDPQATSANRSNRSNRSNRVRSVRAGRGLTQAGLAAEVGVSRQTMGALEAGDYAPSVYLALRIATVLSTTVEELFYEEER